MKNSAINFLGLFSNLKSERRANNLLKSMVKKESVSVYSNSKNWNDAIGNYRMLNNENIELPDIKQGVINDCARKANCSHALIIQDTTQLNYEKHRGRIKPNSGLGVIGDNKSLGYFLHPTFVMNSENGDVYGVSDIKTWIRKENREPKKEEERKKTPIEQKESYRWLDSIEQSKKTLTCCEMLTAISDREGDIYEVFATVPDKRTHLLIRSRDNRLIKEGKLFDYLSEQNVAGTYELEVRGDIRTKRKSRKAIIEIRIAKVNIKKPKTLKKYQRYNETVEVYAIEAKEKENTVPKGEKPIHWRLLTTHQIDTFHAAVFAVFWYSLRWNIEQLFRVLQNKGFNIESSEMEQGTSIIKLGIFALAASIIVMQLLLASKWNSEQAIEQVFNEKECKCLKEICIRYEGKTEKLKNRNNSDTLKWASWVIARVGGWKGYASQRPPGPITFFKGLYKFNLIYEGWSMARKIKKKILKITMDKNVKERSV
ncbi:MAG: IS4 family transposase [bacterium]|nr:IS4 family transposase [bacterium]